MRFRYAVPADVEQLAQMNAQLIRDEGHRNPMTVAQLAERMGGWLLGNYQAVLFEDAGQVVGGQPVGYALFRCEADHVYLRQLFVQAERRRQGIGRQALSWLWQNAWPDTPRLRIEVLINNSAAQAFWRSVGFRDYCLTMEMDPPTP